MRGFNVRIFKRAQDKVRGFEHKSIIVNADTTNTKARISSFHALCPISGLGVRLLTTLEQLLRSTVVVFDSEQTLISQFA
jgi:hypothetical protein